MLLSCMYLLIHLLLSGTCFGYCWKLGTPQGYPNFMLAMRPTCFHIKNATSLPYFHAENPARLLYFHAGCAGHSFSWHKCRTAPLFPCWSASALHRPLASVFSVTLATQLLAYRIVAFFSVLNSPLFGRASFSNLIHACHLCFPFLALFTSESLRAFTDPFVYK